MHFKYVRRFKLYSVQTYQEFAHGGLQIKILKLLLLKICGQSSMII